MQFYKHFIVCCNFNETMKIEYAVIVVKTVCRVSNVLQHKFITGFYSTSSSSVSTAQVHHRFLQHKFITGFYSTSSSPVSTAQAHTQFVGRTRHVFC
ncbi:hypothetical protein HanIR_Chr05g0236691 [Helianthus annuus]|nr:hypothetical protein HanIR_Chr05g0236691 [Helianthus annuus]